MATRNEVALYESGEWGLDILLAPQGEDLVLELQDDSWVIRVVFDRRYTGAIAQQLRRVADQLDGAGKENE